MLFNLNKSIFFVFFRYKSRFGIDVGETSVLLQALPMIGRQYLLTTQGRMSLEKTWSEFPNPYAYQAVVADIAVNDPGYVLYKNITDVYTLKSVVFMLGHPHYGAMGEVIDPGVNVKTGRVKVAMRIVTEPNLDSVKKQFTDSEAQWMSKSIAAQRLGLSSHFLSRITGSIYVTQGSAEAPENGKQNVGLNLKFTKRNEELPGYTKKSSGQWLYSTKSIGLIRSYMHQYPRLFERLAKRVTNDIYTEDDLFESGPEKLSEVVSWLKEQPFASVDTRSCNSLGLDADTIEKIKKEVDKVIESNETETGKTVLMQVKPHLLFKPGLHTGNLPPDPKAQHKLFDRIISVKESSTVPLGYKGTIVGVQRGEDASSNVYDVLFDKEFVGGVSFNGGASNRRYKLHDAEFINISHGIRAEEEIASIASGIGKVATSAPQKSWRQESSSNKKQSQSNTGKSAPHPMRSIPFPAFCQNSKLSNADQQPIRVIKKNDNHQKRPVQQNFDAQQKPKNMQIPPNKARVEKNVPEVVDVKKIVPNVSKPRVDKNSEFQALWNELHKPPTTPGVFTQKPMMPPGMVQQNQIPLPPTGDALQDESAVLKAMLKITDENSSTSSQSTISSANKLMASSLPAHASSAPPLVQQLFDHARQASRKENVSYCAMLLTHSQLTGCRMPRYNYLNNQQKMVCAQIILPDMRSYCGEFCINHAEAAESAAKVVCKVSTSGASWFSPAMAK